MRVTSLISLLIPTLLLACVGTASGQVTTDDIRQGARDRVQGTLAEQEQQAYTRSLLVQFETRIKQTESLLDKIKSDYELFREQSNGLLTSDDGKRLARKGDTVAMHFIALQEQPLVQPSEYAAKREFVEQMLGFLERAQAGPGGYVPQPERVEEADQVYLWARDRAAAIGESTAWLNEALKGIDRTADVSSDPTLKQQIDVYLAARREMWLAARQRGEAAAREAAEPEMEENARIAELERALLESEQSLRLARQEIEQQRIDFEMRMEQQRVELRERLAASQREMDERLAAIERQNRLAEAEQMRRDAEAEAEALAIQEDAKKIELVAKCKSPQVQSDLNAFLASGTWQPGDHHPNMRLDSTPMSLSKLRAFGALDDDTDGIKNLLNVANALGCTPKANGPNGLRGRSHIDTQRPKWGYPRSFSRLTTDDIAEIRRIQGLLRELGPTLVELGMLSE